MLRLPILALLISASTAIQLRNGVDSLKAWPWQDSTLPEGAKWCQVKPCDGSASFNMAVYESGDAVSNKVCKSGVWEELCDAKQFAVKKNEPGAMLDIGANIGYYGLLFANAGFNVIGVEPMPANLKLLEATLEANPQIKEKYHLHKVGLSDKAGEHCVVMAADDNLGNGEIFCSELGDVQEWIVKLKEKSGGGVKEKKDRGHFEVSTLDKVLKDDSFAQGKFDYAKMDVEGMEGLVLRGGASLFHNHAPKRFQSEVQKELKGTTPENLMNIFKDASYTDVGSKGFKSCTKQPKGEFALQYDKNGISNAYLCRSD